MENKRLTGPQAGSLKYDLLTAMAVAGLNGKPGFQTSMMRLIALVTARYNWRQDELTVGQRDIARMWSVDERTVKREIKRLTTAGILLQLRHGVRGRVAAYRLCYTRIYEFSAPTWEQVGPDFSARMQEQIPKPAQTVVKVDFSKGREGEDVASETTGQGTPWGRICARFRDADAAAHDAWLTRLKLVGCNEGTLQLDAPNRFVADYVQTHLHQLIQACAEPELGRIRRVSVTAG